MPESKHSFANDLLSILAGVLAALIFFAVLFPTLIPFAYRFMEFHEHENPSGKSTQNDLAIEIIFYLTLIIPALIGGLTCTLLSTRKRTSFGLLTGLILLLVAYITSIYYLIGSFELAYLKLAVLILAACYLGCFIGIKIKRKRIVNNNDPLTT